MLSLPPRLPAYTSSRAAEAAGQLHAVSIVMVLF